LLAAITLRHSTDIISLGGYSADESQPESHFSNRGRNRNGIRLDRWRANAGSASTGGNPGACASGHSGGSSCCGSRPASGGSRSACGAHVERWAHGH